jgi:hypothetical protein
MSKPEPVITIPDDLGACQALLEQLAGTIGHQAKAIGELKRKHEELKLACKALLQQACRRRSERYIDDPNQIKLDFGASDDVANAAEGLSQAIEEERAIEEARAAEEAGVVVNEHVRWPRKPRHGKHVERYEVVVEHGRRKLIG